LIAEPIGESSCKKGGPVKARGKGYLKGVGPTKLAWTRGGKVNRTKGGYVETNNAIGPGGKLKIREHLKKDQGKPSKSGMVG